MYAVVVGDVLSEAHDVVKAFRDSGINVAIDITNRKPDKQIKTALKLGVQYLLFIGAEELANKKYILRNIETQNEGILNLEDIIKVINS